MKMTTLKWKGVPTRAQRSAMLSWLNETWGAMPVRGSFYDREWIIEWPGR